MRKLYSALLIGAFVTLPLLAQPAERSGVIEIQNETRDAYLSVRVSYGNRNILESTFCVKPGSDTRHDFRASILNVNAQVMQRTNCVIARGYGQSFRPRNRSHFRVVLTGSYKSPNITGG